VSVLAQPLGVRSSIREYLFTPGTHSLCRERPAHQRQGVDPRTEEPTSTASGARRQLRQKAKLPETDASQSEPPAPAPTVASAHDATPATAPTPEAVSAPAPVEPQSGTDAEAEFNRARAALAGLESAQGARSEQLAGLEYETADLEARLAALEAAEELTLEQLLE
jgi:hypothetical protein